MKIDDELLDNLQKMGMIEINQDKREEVKEQISEILGFVENLSSLNFDEVSFKNTQKTPLREDLPKDSGIRDDVLNHAPNAKDGFFIVPKIIE